MSYEDVPLEDYRDDDPPAGNLTKRFLRMFLILFLAVVAVLAVLNIEKLTPDNIAHWFQYDLLGKTEGNGYPTGFAGGAVSDGNFSTISGVPVYVSDTSIGVLNPNAGIYHEDQHSYAHPMLSVNGAYAIVANVDGTGFTVMKRDNIVHTGSTKKRIFAGDVADNGVYALLTKGEDYLSALTVYRADNRVKYRYSFADYYMNTVTLNRDGTRAVLTGVSGRGGGLISVIYVLDFKQDNYLQRYEVDDTYIYSACYMDNGNAFCVGNDKAFFININDGSKTDIGYDGRTLTDFALRRSDGMLLSLSQNPDGRECDLLGYNRYGDRCCDFSTGMQVISLDIWGDRYSVLTPEKIVVYDGNGHAEASADADTDARRIVSCDYHTFYVLGKSRISRIKAE